MHSVRLVRRGGHKPRDVGTGLVNASLANGGRRWLSLAGPHPAVGYLELTGMPPFDEARRGDPAAVRAYRALMADGASAFLLIDTVGSARVDARLLGPRAGERTIAQRLHLRATPGETQAGLRLSFRGRLQLPALAMITEPGRRAPGAPLEYRLLAEGRRLRIVAPALESQVAIDVSGGVAAEWGPGGDGTAAYEIWLSDPDAQAELVLSCRLITPRVGRDEPSGTASRRHVQAVRPATVTVPRELRADVDRISRRALRYVRECTALAVAPGRAAILTDHRLLPLSWTRDAYWQALLLLRHGYGDIVADHLRWLWLDCKRPERYWARSHHADGRPHDDIYQADQQLYPLLELAEYRATTGGLPELGASFGEVSNWSELAQPVLADLERRLSAHGLLATDENAADDPARLPYLLPNQLLASHTLGALADVPELAGLVPDPRELARRLRTAVDRHFVVDGPAGSMWAYAVDAAGDALRYHDANDVPTALAPLWGLCSADDPVWRATMEFAFSADNPAYVQGRAPGLGSRHTPGVWPLGLIQEWIARSMCSRDTEAADALRRLVGCAMQDGALPEASDADTASVVARHWFAWPGAMLGALAKE